MQTTRKHTPRDTHAHTTHTDGGYEHGGDVSGDGDKMATTQRAPAETDTTTRTAQTRRDNQESSLNTGHMQHGTQAMVGSGL